MHDITFTHCRENLAVKTIKKKKCSCRLSFPRKKTAADGWELKLQSTRLLWTSIRSLLENVYVVIRHRTNLWKSTNSSRCYRFDQRRTTRPLPDVLVFPPLGPYKVLLDIIALQGPLLLPVLYWHREEISFPNISGKSKSNVSLFPTLSRRHWRKII